MKTLTELLDVDLSYEEILDELEDQTDNFTVYDGTIAFDDQYESELAISILKDHYNTVTNDGIDMIEEALGDSEDSGAYVISFSNPIIDDLDFPKEVESLNEGLSVSKETRQRINDSVKGSKILKKTNNPEGLINAIIKLIEEDKIYDYYNYGPYKENEYPDDLTDAYGRNTNKKLKKIHDFWLQFGLDTSQRGIGTRIDSLSSDIRNIIEETPEYHDSLPDDATEKLPPSEQFKINLFYEWDAMHRNFFGDYDDDDPELDMSFNEWLRYTYKTGHYEGEKRKWLEDAIRETSNKSQHYGDDVEFVKDEHWNIGKGFSDEFI